jgi:hypothetical protein
MKTTDASCLAAVALAIWTASADVGFAAENAGPDTVLFADPLEGRPDSGWITFPAHGRKTST